MSNINCIRLTSHRAGKLGTDTKEGQDLSSNVKYLVGWLVGWLVFVRWLVCVIDWFAFFLVGFVVLFCRLSLSACCTFVQSCAVKFVFFAMVS